MYNVSGLELLCSNRSPAICCGGLLGFATMQPAEVAKQIEGCSAFFASQQALLGSEKQQECAGAMCSSIVHQIKALGGLVVQDASVLSAAIAASGFSAKHKAELAHAVAEGASKSAVPELKARKCCQTWTAVETYLTKDDWTTLQGTASRATKVAVVVDRLYKAGLSCPSEATVKHMVALVASVHCPQATANDLHEMVLQVKTTVKGQQGHAVVLQHVKTFPPAPADLPEANYKNAYSEAQPCICSVPGFQEVLNKVPLRTTNRAIAGVGGSHGAIGNVAPQQDRPSAMEFMSMFWQHLQAQQQQSHTPSLRFTDPSTLSAKAAALVDSPAAPQAAPLMILDKDNQSPAASDRSAPSTGTGPSQSPVVAAAEPRPALPPPAQSVDDQIAALERLAAGCGADGKPATLPVAGKTKGNRKAAKEAVVKAKPAAVMKTIAKKNTDVASKSLQLGCGKCRGSPTGCVQCRNPSYGGKRFTRQ